MKRKGFTLIELLAVLVVLSVIAIIAVPNVNDIVNNSKKKSAESSAQMLAKTAESYFANQNLIGDSVDKVNLADETLSYTGDKPDIGYAFFDEDGRAYVKMYYNGYCVIRDYNGKVESDKTSPDNCKIVNMVSVTLYTNGGVLTNTDGWNVLEDHAIKALETGTNLSEIFIEKPGYTFKGWYDENENLVNLSDAIIEDITVTARWGANKYIITLDLAGGIIDGEYESTRTITYGESYGELPTPAKPGYTFIGWYTSGGLRVEDETILSNPKNHTLYANYEANKYILTFKYNDNETNDTEKTVTYGESYGELPEPSRAGYTFQGWFTNLTNGSLVTSETTINSAGDHTLYASWIANTYTITFNRTIFSDGETVYFNPVTGNACSASEYTTSQSAIEVKTGCMKWYAFLDSEDSSTLNLILDHNTTGKVAWNSNTSGTTPDTVNAKLQDDITNWNDAVKSTARLISASEVNQIAPAYASHTWDINNYKTYYYYFHTGTTTSYNGAAGSNTYAWLFANTYNCTTYGCNTADNGTYGYWTSSFASSGRAWSVNCYGALNYAPVDYNFTDLGVRPVITISKSVIGLETKEVTYDGTYGTLPTPTKKGYTFNGWATSGGTIITADSIVKITSNISVYPQWGINSYLVTFDGNGGTSDIPNSTITYGNQYGTLPSASRTGYTFNGWYTSPTGGTEVTSTTTMNTVSNHSIYAQWTANKYTITIIENGNENGTPVYFNPVTGLSCTSTEAEENVNNFKSANGTITCLKEGCMKWYVFLDSGESDGVSLILDHDIVYGISNGILVNLDSQLKSKIENWDASVQSMAGLISIDEVNKIAPSLNGESEYNFHTGADKTYQGATGTNKYAWLFDNTYRCTKYGCNIEDSMSEGYHLKSGLNGLLYGYGTVSFDGYLRRGSQKLGIRPAITVSKSTVGLETKTIKEVTYDSTYGELPTLTKEGYTFDGWATSSGVKVESTTKILNASNHTIYPQWIANTHNVTFVYNNGSANTTKEVVYNGTYGTLPTPIKEGYAFNGWATSGGIVLTENSKVIITKDITLYAQWTTPVVVVNNINYASINGAISAQPSGSTFTIKVLKNISDPVTIGNSKNVTINLNSYTISNNVSINSSSSLTIYDGTISVTSGYAISNSGTVNISGTVKIKGTGTSATISNSSTGIVIITGGTITATKRSAISNSGTVNIGGAAVIDGTGTSATISNSSTGIVTITGGTITATKSSVIDNSGTVDIGGSAVIDGLIDTYPTILNQDTGILIMTGGTVSNTNIAISSAASGTLNLDDGTIIGVVEIQPEPEPETE